jgi:dCTP deaminase
MQLSDIDIENALNSGDITFSNFDKNRVQPASYDVLLGYEFLIFDSHNLQVIDPKISIQDQMRKVVLKSKDDFLIIHPNEMILGVTYDRVGVSEKLACQVMGKSSLARLGLIVHTTAGFIDPGNELNITLELVNTNKVGIKLYPEMKIGQVAFWELKTPASRAYGHKDLNSKYFKASSVQASSMHLNYDQNR